MATGFTKKATSNGSSPKLSRDGRGRSALEADFPFEKLHPLAELESWRKEVSRPIYHVHKWWANRLGSVFRAIVLAGNLGPDADVWAEFYQSHDFSDRTVLDPFMGSGTTIGEALKLGCRAVGCDINPVSYFQVRKALEACDENTLLEAYQRVERRVASRICQLYKSTYNRLEADILYTFWVKVLRCPTCQATTRLFRKWIFAADAYPGQKPQSSALCPRCGEMNTVLYTADAATCVRCAHAFHPQRGPVEGQQFRCEGCGESHRIITVVRAFGTIPEHEMYALMLLLPNGEKVYKRPDDADRTLYEKAEGLLRESTLPIPETEIPPGHNTNQARGYHYCFWREMFNARQLYALGTLLQGILEEPHENARECLLLLFSGVLEFNNMFCSFKGQGTGAVRHLFHHHILKPERTPLEAHPWGTPRSSGSFSTLFERRLLAAKRYCADPFELRVTSYNGRPKGEKVFGLNKPLRPRLTHDFQDLAEGKADALLFAGDSSRLPVPDVSVDLVVTDPPYFDNVHYSELADFFYCWLKLGLERSEPAFRAPWSRSTREVQGTDAASFGQLLGEVLKECARVLKPDGVLAFTFHHARDEAWKALAGALECAGLEVTQAHPVKAEMSVAMPKNQAKEPINLDLIIVCRHVENGSRSLTIPSAIEDAASIVQRFNTNGIRLSKGDIRVVLMGSLLKVRGKPESVEDLTGVIASLHKAQEVRKKSDESLQQDMSINSDGEESAAGAVE